MNTQGVAASSLRWRRVPGWYRHSYQMLADASGFYGSKVIELRPPRGGYNPVGLRKVPDGAAKNNKRREVMPA
jgi:hypothetical protein